MPVRPARGPEVMSMRWPGRMAGASGSATGRRSGVNSPMVCWKRRMSASGMVA